MFAKVTVDTPENADKARRQLNLIYINPTYFKYGRPVRICRYQITRESDDSDKNILVKNIHKSVNSRQFYEMFLEFGDIKSCKLEMDFFGSSKGYGYVYYQDEESADKAIEKLV